MASFTQNLGLFSKEDLENDPVIAGIQNTDSDEDHMELDSDYSSGNDSVQGYGEEKRGEGYHSDKGFSSNSQSGYSESNDSEEGEGFGVMVDQYGEPQKIIEEFTTEEYENDDDTPDPSLIKRFLDHLVSERFSETRTFFTTFDRWTWVGKEDDDLAIQITSFKMDEDSRFSRIVLDDRVRDQFERAGNEVVRWLFMALWNSGYTHGDLTEDNLLFTGNSQICVIDWWDTLTEAEDEDIGSPFHLYRVLLDLYDVLNSIHLVYSDHSDQNLPERIAGFEMIDEDDVNIFDELYNVIKRKEGEYDYDSQELGDKERIMGILRWMDNNELLPHVFQDYLLEDDDDDDEDLGGGRRRKTRKRKRKKRKEKKKKKTKKRKTKKRRKKKTKKRRRKKKKKTKRRR